MMTDIFIDELGGFQLPVEELTDFVPYLRDHEVPCDVEESGTFRAAGRAYGLGRLQHLYDVDTTLALYQTWSQTAREGRAVVAR